MDGIIKDKSLEELCEEVQVLNTAVSDIKLMLTQFIAAQSEFNTLHIHNTFSVPAVPLPQVLAEITAVETGLAFIEIPLVANKAKVNKIEKRLEKKRLAYISKIKQIKQNIEALNKMKDMKMPDIKIGYDKIPEVKIPENDIE